MPIPRPLSWVFARAIAMLSSIGLAPGLAQSEKPPTVEPGKAAPRPAGPTVVDPAVERQRAGVPGASHGQFFDAEAARVVLQTLDARFGDRDIAGYLEQFDPDHPGAHAMLGRHLERTAAATSQRRTSTVIGAARQVGPRSVVRVQHEIFLQVRSQADPRRRDTAQRDTAQRDTAQRDTAQRDTAQRDTAPRDTPPSDTAQRAPGSRPGSEAGSEPESITVTYVEHSLLACRQDEGGRWVPTFAIEMPVQSACAVDDFFRCPACNYEIGGVAGWLCVPIRNDRARALEAVSFYLLGTDLAFDVSIQIDPDAPSAMALVGNLGEALRDGDPSARPGVPTAWLPPAHASTAPAGLSAAQLEVDLPGDYPQHGGGFALFHVVTFGGLQHVLLGRGSREAMQRHGDALAQLLASYRLLEIDCDRVVAASRPLSHHTGCRLDGSDYHNDLRRVVLEGPPGWKPELRSGGAALRVAWRSRDGGRLWLVGYEVPPGLPRWCPITADRWVRKLCEQHALAVPATLTAGSTSAGVNAAPDQDTDSGWHADDCGGLTRTLKCTTPGDRGPTPGPRWIRLLLHDDLLLVADGAAATADDEAALRQSLGTLRRR